MSEPKPLTGADIENVRKRSRLASMVDAHVVRDLLATIDALKAERDREKERADKEEGDRRAADHALNDFVCTWSKAAPETAKVRAVLDTSSAFAPFIEKVCARRGVIFQGEDHTAAEKAWRAAVRAWKGDAE